MHIAKKWIYAKPFVDEPTLDNFELVEEPVPELQDGGKDKHKPLSSSHTLAKISFLDPFFFKIGHILQPNL